MFSKMRRLFIAEPAPSNPETVLMEVPWRKINWENNEDNLNYVTDYKPKTEGQLLRILLYGPAGAGKSSFLNSVQSVLRGRIYTQALANNSGGCFTKRYRTYKIQKDEESYPFVFNDIMGLGELTGVVEKDITLALKGHLKEGYRFNPESHLLEGEEFYNESPKANDKIHVLVCVIPADTLHIMTDQIVGKIKSVRQEASMLEIPQVAIITKIDLTCPEMKEDIKHVYKVQDVKNMMEKFSGEVGIPMNCIFPVKNYHEEIDLDEDMNTLILSAMKHIITCGDDFLSFKRNQSESS